MKNCCAASDGGVVSVIMGFASANLSASDTFVAVAFANKAGPIYYGADVGAAGVATFGFYPFPDPTSSSGEDCFLRANITVAPMLH